MGKKDDKLTELSYTIEALEDEVEYFKEVVGQKQSRISDLISENDRLTMTYEPYRPPGDDMESISYSDLNEENDSLTQNIMDKIHVIHEQEEEITRLWTMVKEFQAEAHQLDQMIKAQKTKRKNYAGVLSFDFWPLGDWFRLNLYRWNPGKAFQLCIGPFRLDFFES